MAYWLLLGLVYCLGLSLLLLSTAKHSESRASLWAGMGALFFALGLGAELALGIEFNQYALRIFYLFRILLPLAWLGHSLLVLVWPPRSLVRWAGFGLLLASLAGLALVWRTGITAAQDWFDPGLPVFRQYAETLATNRPTRALGLLMNVYGGVVLTVLALLIPLGHNQRKSGQTWLASAAVLLGEIALLWPLLRNPSTFGTLFYVGESLSFVVLLSGIVFFLLPPEGEAAVAPARRRLSTWLERFP